jgi:hypothetical protein
MGHSDLSAGIGPIAASQFGGSQPYVPERRPLVSKRDEENRHRQQQDAFLKDEEGDENGEQEGDESEETSAAPHAPPAELEPLSASIRGPEQHIGLLLDVKL